ncbi:uncharacterized protein LOC106656597 [Trichogramma pretiosum]|uniref:uncharacterized protein LOC106656597 n=1 Tax=Trichogramma pretiosum TaxID=7493 RepID=UPI0006C9DE06|nr:uncharacterized protein LOC106656597 [Trichogramma pretiosum]
MGNVKSRKSSGKHTSRAEKIFENAARRSSATGTTVNDQDFRGTSKSHSRREQRRELLESSLLRTTNPFFAFFLRLRNKRPDVPVTKIARIAGQRWKTMSEAQRSKYIEIASKEKDRRVTRRQQRSNKGKRKCNGKRILSLGKDPEADRARLVRPKPPPPLPLANNYKKQSAAAAAAAAAATSKDRSRRTTRTRTKTSSSNTRRSTTTATTGKRKIVGVRKRSHHKKRRYH